MPTFEVEGGQRSVTEIPVRGPPSISPGRQKSLLGVKIVASSKGTTSNSVSAMQCLLGQKARHEWFSDVNSNDFSRNNPKIICNKNGRYDNYITGTDEL